MSNVAVVIYARLLIEQDAIPAMVTILSRWRSQRCMQRSARGFRGRVASIQSWLLPSAHSQRTSEADSNWDTTLWLKGCGGVWRIQDPLGGRDSRPRFCLQTPTPAL
jgi:hypothetical protein